jgi:hypothetical protein
MAARRKTVRRPRKQSSPRTSTLAGRLMRFAQEMHLLGFENAVVSVRELKTLCASVLSQDEQRGQLNGKR